jgi:hypothetical protein
MPVINRILKEKETEEMAFPILNPDATVSVAVEGLAVYNHNPLDDNGRVKWQVAIPRFLDHELLLRIPNIGTLFIDRGVRRIELKDRSGVPVNKPLFEGANFDRRNVAKSDPLDYRWLTDFTNNSEIPHETVSLNTNPGVLVTMLNVYDAVFYTKKIEDHPLILATHRETCPVVNCLPIPLPPAQSGPILDAIVNPYGHSATAVGIDIESPSGGVVDLILDGSVAMSFPKTNGLTELFISNLEPATVAFPKDAIVITSQARYGRGDFFRYYQLFNVTGGDSFHLWEKFPPTPSPGIPDPAITGDCNGTGGRFASLEDLLP